MCDCSEERDRRARERARKAEELRRRIMSEYESDDDLGGEPPPPRTFSPVQIALGSVGFLLALLALLLKNVDTDKLHTILSKVGLGHLVPKRVKEETSIDKKEQIWPKSPKLPPCPPKPPKKC